MSATFDHRSAGTRAADWTAAGLDLLEPVSVSDAPLIVLAAHPDDESLGAGGLLAASAGVAASITVIVATDGENSHPGSTTRTPRELAVIRREEVTTALERVAPGATVANLGLPDGALGDYTDTLDVALRALIAPAAASGVPVRVVTPWRGDAHPDHEACALAVTRAAREHAIEHWEYPIWAWHWADPAGDDVPWARLRRLDLTAAQQAAKRRALGEHVSQHRALSDLPGDEPVLPAAVLEHFDRPYECFVVPAPAGRGDYFDALYAETPDPWGLADRFYEQRKRALVLASLPRRRFRRAFEPGCATGLLTVELATRCDDLVAWDVAAAAVEQARERVEAMPARSGSTPTIERGRIPQDWPDGKFDLLMLSEVGYYCDLDQLRERVLASLTDDGVVVGCHWRHPAADHPHNAEDVHAIFDEILHRDVHHVERDFRLDVWSRAGSSVAEAEGIV